MTNSGPDTMTGPFLVDAHVHFYPCYRREPFLDGALANFRRHGRRLRIETAAPSFLLLTEAAADHWFRELREAAAAGEAGRWTFRATADECSLVASRGEEAAIVVVAGRQIAAREGLEVLALGLDEDVPDGLPLRVTLVRVADAGAVPVIPWGFGKWWFRRGAVLRALLEAPPARGFFLGDNGGRPRGFGAPAPFAGAGRQGIRILPGSDPLPFPWHEKRAGSTGFVLDGVIDAGRPGAGLKSRLRGLASQPRAYGDGEPLPVFLLHQLVMQLRKRAASARRAPASR